MSSENSHIMPTALNDIFQLKMKTVGSNSPVEALNVFWFKLTNFGTIPVGDPVAAELNSAFGVNTVPEIITTITVSTAIFELETVNYANVTDFDVCDTACGLSALGTVVGDTLPWTNCWSFRYNRPGPGFRSGYKRFAGVGEASVDNAGIATGATVAELATLAVQLGDDLISGALCVFEPVVARGIKVLGANPLYQDVPSVDYAGLGTQNSRKKPLF